MSAGNTIRSFDIRQIIDSRIRVFANTGISWGTNNWGGYPNASIYGGTTAGFSDAALPSSSHQSTTGVLSAAAARDLIREFSVRYGMIQLVRMRIFNQWHNGKGGIGNQGSGQTLVSDVSRVAFLSSAYNVSVTNTLPNFGNGSFSANTPATYSEVVRYADLIRARVNALKTNVTRTFTHVGCHTSCHQSCHTSRSRR